MASVILENVNKTYRSRKSEVQAVVDLNISIADQELIVLVGPSGCGKTTTLRLIAGLEDLTSGQIQIDNQVVNRIAPKDRDIAMVFQNYALYPHMTVYKNMAFGLKMRKTPREEIKRRVHEMANLLGLEHLLERKPADLSGGECQRVAVGRAIVRKPRVFLLDEPLANLDARLRTATRSEIKTLQRNLKTTMIYVTHDQEEAMTLGDRIVVMKGGMIQQCDSPLDIYRQPVNRFVAGFIGSPAMNFLEGQIEMQNSSLTFDCPTGKFSLPKEISIKNDHFSGKSVVMGIRPESIHLLSNEEKSNESPPSDSTLSATVNTVEPLGDRTYIHFHTHDGINLIANAQPFVDISPGQNIRVQLDLSQAHFFSTDQDGQRIH